MCSGNYCMHTRLCNRCSVILSVGDNWLIYSHKKNDYICRKCLTIRGREYCEKNNITKEDKAIYDKQYRAKNLTIIKYKKKIYRNKPETKKKINEKHQKKYDTDFSYKLGFRISETTREILNSLQRLKNKSSKKWLDAPLKEYEKKFQILLSMPSNFDKDGNVWMTLENHGINTWHIDHINPISKIIEKYEKELELHKDSPLMLEKIIDVIMKEALSINNLRPLEAKKNISDGNNRSKERITAIKQEIEDFINESK